MSGTVCQNRSNRSRNQTVVLRIIIRVTVIVNNGLDFSNI